MRANIRAGVRVPDTNRYLLIFLCSLCELAMRRAHIKLIGRRTWKGHKQMCNACEGMVTFNNPEVA